MGKFAELKFGKLCLLVFAPVFIVFAVYVSTILFLTWPIELWTVSQAGVFGDSFGVITSLFSAMAFGGLIVTIVIQREELSLTRNELVETRNDAKDQSFEDNFFKMISILNQIIDSIDLRSGNDVIASGRDCFSTFLKRYRQSYVQSLRHEQYESAAIEVAFVEFWDRNRLDLSHYYRFLYNIFRYIDEKGPSGDKLYIKLLRAQLSDYELAVLFYNCLSIQGKKFKEIAEKHCIFDNLPDDLLIDKKHKNYFNPIAFNEA